MRQQDITRIINRKNFLEEKGLNYQLLKNCYIEENKSLKNLSENLNLTLNQVRSILKFYRLKKTEEKILESVKTIAKINANNLNSEFRKSITVDVRRKAQKAAMDSKNKNYEKILESKGINKEKLQELYIEKNYSLNDLASYFNYSKSGVRNLLKKFNVESKNTILRNEAKFRNSKILYSDKDKVNEIVSKVQKTISDKYSDSWYIKNSSKPEKEIVNFIEINFPHVEIVNGSYSLIRNPFTGAALQVDIYIPSLSIAFEFNGEYCHDKKLYENDLLNNTCFSKEFLKEKLCNDVGVKLFHLWYGDYKENRELFFDNLSKIINNYCK